MTKRKVICPNTNRRCTIHRGPKLFGCAYHINYEEAVLCKYELMKKMNEKEALK